MNVTEITTEDRVGMHSVTLTVAPVSGVSYKVKLQQRRFEKPGQYWARTRVYVTIPENALPPHPPYGSTRGDGSEEDAAWRKFNRLEVSVMKGVAEQFRPVWEALTAGVAGNLHFSRKAGCSCSCSPGFLLDNTLRFHSSPCDIWIWPAN